MKGFSWKVGKVEIFQIVELECGKVIQSIIEKATPENIQKIDWLKPHFADSDGTLKALVQAFLIKSAGKNILIDACNGNDKTRTDLLEWSMLKTGFLNNLAQTGVTPKDINIVACTHLHTDHVGWNTQLKDGVWVPTFPQAKYLFSKEEFEYWQQKPAQEYSDDKSAFADSVSPIVNAGLSQLVSSDYVIDNNIRLVPTPGHTPGHVSILIESQSKRALISGDFVHHPCQIAYPEWKSFDSISDKAVATRRRLLAEIADTDTLLIGSHFANPVAGRVMSTNLSYILKT